MNKTLTESTRRDSVGFGEGKRETNEEDYVLSAKYAEARPFINTLFQPPPIASPSTASSIQQAHGIPDIEAANPSVLYRRLQVCPLPCRTDW